MQYQRLPHGLRTLRFKWCQQPSCPRPSFHLLFVSGAPCGTRASRPLPTAVCGGSVIQALIIPAGPELRPPRSPDCCVWPGERQTGMFRRTRRRVCQISFSSSLSELKHNKQGEVISLQLPRRVGFKKVG